MSYSIYTLSASGAPIQWKAIRYVGMSIDIFSRFKQHLTSHDDTNPEKSAWIQGLLAQGRTPTLGRIEEVGTKEEARKRVVQSGHSVYRRGTRCSPPETCHSLC